MAGDQTESTKVLPWDPYYDEEESLLSFSIKIASGLVTGENESNHQAEPEPIREEGAESAKERSNNGSSAPGSNYTCSTLRWEQAESLS